MNAEATCMSRVKLNGAKRCTADSRTAAHLVGRAVCPKLAHLRERIRAEVFGEGSNPLTAAKLLK